MNVKHHYCFNTFPEIEKRLLQLGIALSGKALTTISVFETDESWQTVHRLMRSIDAFERVETVFDELDPSTAKLLELGSDWFAAYPEPKPDSFGYRNQTYDLEFHCEKCGTGMRQKGPFLMKKAPKWGKRSICHLHWVYGEFFVNDFFVENVAGPFGISTTPVLNLRNEELADTHQLVVDNEVEIDTAHLTGNECSACGVMKYMPDWVGMFPSVQCQTLAPIARTRQYFGDGGSAWKAVVVSQEMFVAMTKLRIKGVTFRPAADRGQPTARMQRDS